MPAAHGLMFDLYVLLAFTAMLLIMVTMGLISNSSFLGNAGERRWLRETRRASLALVGAGIAISIRWHIESGRGAWLPEYLLISGVDLYLATAIYSTYQWIRHLRLVA